MTRPSLPGGRYWQNETIVLFESENEKKFPDFYSAGGKSGSWEGGAKSIKALNHEEHEGHKEKEKLFFVLFVSFVVPFFSEPFETPS